jgi:hypothetical protein
MSTKDPNFLTRLQYRKLEDFLNENKTDLEAGKYRSLGAVAQIAQKKLGFDITTWNTKAAAETMGIAINTGNENNTGFSQIWRAVRDMQARIESLESLLESKTAPQPKQQQIYLNGKATALTGLAGSTPRI